MTDVSGGSITSFEKLARGAAGLAGAQAEPFRVWLEDWSVAGSSAGTALLHASVNDPASNLSLNLDLSLADLKGPVLQGDRGYSRKGPEPGNASYYFSLPRLASEGRDNRQRANVQRIRPELDGSRVEHQTRWGRDQAGWDWFSIQLEDDTELMLFQLRRADGSVDGFSSGTLIAADGTTRMLTPGDFKLEVTDRWRSPRTAAEYPARWTLSVPSADLRLTLTPWLADQEMDVSYAYWEGAVKAEGTRNGQPVTGNGYAELTGYAGSMQGQF